MDQVFRKLEQGKSKAFFFSGRKTINRKLWRPVRSIFLVKGYERSAVVAQPWPFGAISPWNNCRFVTYRRSRGSNGSVELADFHWFFVGTARRCPSFSSSSMRNVCKCRAFAALVQGRGRSKEEGFKGERFSVIRDSSCAFFFFLLIKLVKSWCLGWAWIWRIKDLN